MSVMLINVTITRQVLSGAFPQRSKERVTLPVWLFCAVGVEKPELQISSVAVHCFILPRKYALIIPQPMSTPSSPVSTFLLRPALRARSCLTLMDDSSSLCAQHAIRCAILTDRGMEGQFANADFWSIQCGKTFIKRSVPFFFFVSLSYYLCGAVRGAVELITLYFYKACLRRSHDWWTIKVHFLFCLGC